MYKFKVFRLIHERFRYPINYPEVPRTKLCGIKYREHVRLERTPEEINVGETRDGKNYCRKETSRIYFGKRHFNAQRSTRKQRAFRLKLSRDWIIKTGAISAMMRGSSFLSIPATTWNYKQIWISNVWTVRCLMRLRRTLWICSSENAS